MAGLLFYDFETTGIPDYSQPSNAWHQPHIVQAAVALVDLGSRKTLASFDLTVKPEGWSIPPETTALHGITEARAAAVGLPEADVTRLLLALWRQADCRIGHNESFDARIMRIALKRHADDLTADLWKHAPAECTARLARPLCLLPKNKIPTLGEAYERLCGRPMQNAHTAQADVEACMAVYWVAKGYGLAGYAA